MTTSRPAQLLFALVGMVSVLGAAVHAVVGAPVLNNNQPALTSGPTLTLSWAAPTLGTPTSYLVEASSSPGGPPNLANFNTGSTQTSLVAPDVPPGTYYVRVRGVDASGPGPASNEVTVTIGSGGVCPSAPLVLNIAAQNGGAVTLSWQAPLTGAPGSYVIQAGSSSNTANLANVDTNSTALVLAVPNVPPGTYFVRVYARSNACAGPSLLGPPSNEVVLSVGGASLGAPVLNNNQPVQSSGPTVTLSWTAPASGLPSSYTIEAAATPAGPASLANFNTGTTQTSLVVPNVPPGTYHVRVRAVGANGPGPVSNEVALTVGATAAWGGEIECRLAIAGDGYAHNETQRWLVGLPAQVVSSARTNYRALWSAQGSGGGAASSWTINSAATTDLSATVIASTGLTTFDRTTAPVLIRNGIVASPTPFDLYEIEFPTIVGSSPGATLVSGTWSRPTVGGDSPQQPGGATGTLTCTWSLRYQ
jgi:hypothetical protein